MKWGDLATEMFGVCVCLLAQSCLTLCNPMDCSLPAFFVHGILQARILEWVAMSSSKGSSQPRDQTSVSYLASGYFTAKPPGKTSRSSQALYKIWISTNVFLSIAYVSPYLLQNDVTENLRRKSYVNV